MLASERSPKRRVATKILQLRWRRSVAVAVCGGLGLLFPAAFGTWQGVPHPLIHDEFSYLLGADTFAQGRLTNPALAFPDFFEAPHVLVAPSYASKYPPGQALFLALGQVAGEPIWGVWLSCGLFAASLCWMLQAWTSRKWAIVVTVVAIMTLGTSTYWAQSYWGGMVAAAAGALVLGALRRTLRRPRLVTSLTMAAGVLLLANSRPFEGLLLCLPVALVLATWLTGRGRGALRTRLALWLVPFGIVLTIGAGIMLAYNQAVTGRAWRTPYDLHVEQYQDIGVFLFSSSQEPGRVPTTRVRDFYEGFMFPPGVLSGPDIALRASVNAVGRLLGALLSAFGLNPPPAPGQPPFRGVLLASVMLMALSRRLSSRDSIVFLSVAAAVEGLIWFFAPYPTSLWVPVLLIGVALLLRMSRTSAWLRFIYATVCVVVIGQSLVWWWQPHYAAPIVPLVLAAAGILLRRRAIASSLSRAGGPAGVALAACVCIHATSLLLLYGFLRVEGVPDGLSRASLERQLASMDGRHLVFLSYGPSFPENLEWVYNGADLETARVVFAHDRGDNLNQSLIAAFSGRHVWSAQVAAEGYNLSRYEPGKNRSPTSR
ncbi:MAG: hypothetical protein AB7F99_12800 [Vicinamibacterales bacterium]